MTTLDDHSVVPAPKTNPVIDLENRVDAVQQIRQACQQYGFFQVVNHGVCGNLTNETMSVIKEFFELPHEVKAKQQGEYLENENKILPDHLINSTGRKHAAETVTFFKETLKHNCHLLDYDFWPEKPTKYREVVGKYTTEMSDFALKLMELYCEGLGLEPGYFGDEYSALRKFSGNHYPPYAVTDPSLILGLPKHCDPNIMNIVLQDGTFGLQVFKDGQWLDVDPNPNSFVVIVGRSLEVEDHYAHTLEHLGS